METTIVYWVYVGIIFVSFHPDCLDLAATGESYAKQPETEPKPRTATSDTALPMVACKQQLMSMISQSGNAEKQLTVHPVGYQFQPLPAVALASSFSDIS